MHNSYGISSLEDNIIIDKIKRKGKGSTYMQRASNDEEMFQEAQGVKIVDDGYDETISSNESLYNYYNVK